MDYSFAWLGQYVDLNGVDLHKLLNQITLSVAEIEGSHDYGAGLGKVCVAKVLETTPHESAAKITICKIDSGSGEKTVVCGAPNVRVGMLTAYAPPGTVIKGREIKAAEVRGVHSVGMLCSPAELDLYDDPDIICELDDDLKPGTLLSDFLPITDTVFEVDNKSITHRPDLWGYVGMAREVAALLGRPLELPPDDVTLGSDKPVEIDLAAPDGCPRYTALGLEVPAVKPSPLWMQSLLHRSGVRPISNVVDLTNYVMLEWGNPIHAFDARQIQGGKIRVAFAEDGQKVTTLDNEERTLTKDELLICDGERPVAIAGVMGLANSEIMSDTTKILLEVANFRPDMIRRSATRLKMRTEASSRFEKSLDPELPATVAKRFAYLMQQTVPGSKITSGLADAHPNPPAPKRIDITTTYINSRLGTSLSTDDVTKTLEALSFVIEADDGDKITVRVPTFRATRDISIPDDLVEEVGRIHGYDNITPVHPAAQVITPFREQVRILKRRVQLALSLSAGYNEVQTYSFDFEPLLERIGRSDDPRVAARNPISAESTHLRPHLLPNLIGALEKNLRQFDDLHIYELGRVFRPNAPEIPVQPYHLGMIVWGSGSDDWSTAQTDALDELKAALADLFARLRITVEFHRAESPLTWLHPVRTAEVRLSDGTVLGQIGALHPRVCETLECGPYAAAAELNIEPIIGREGDIAGYAAIAKYPSVPFDLSVVVPDSVTHSDIYADIKSSELDHLQSTEYITTYRGGPIPEGQKSVTYKLTFQSPERSLTMEEVKASVDALVAKLKDHFGAWLRT